MLDTLKTNLNILMLAASLGFAVLIVHPEADAGSCGAGCQRSMGSCTVNSDLWASLQTARSSGIRATSCCRSQEYNNRMRSCGYFPSPSSKHMSGNAVDLIVSPARCNGRNLAQYGFTNVCPHYHYGHCHVQTCGSPRSAYAAREKARDNTRRIRRENYRRPLNRAQYKAPARTRRYSEAPPEGYMFDVAPTWWESIDVGVEQ